MIAPPPVIDVAEPSPSLLRLTHVIYALHSASLVVGIVGAATVVGAFLLGWPSLIAVILNYIKRGEARGTWLDSHFRWQIRTFWFGLLWGVLGGILALVVVGFFILAADAIWIIYRIAKGWLRLSENREIS